MKNNTIYLEAAREKHRLKIGIYTPADVIWHYEELPAPMDEIEKATEAMVEALNKANRKGHGGPQEFERLKSVGRMFCDELLTWDIKEKLRNSDADYLVLKLDDRLVHIPWELLCLDDEFLCQRFSMGRSVKTRQKIAESSGRHLERPFNMWILANPKGDLDVAASEGLKIFQNMAHMNQEEDVIEPFLDADITPEEIRERIKSYDFVHFAGHAEYASQTDHEGPEQSGWKLSDGNFSVQDIDKMASSSAMPSFVFSNACQSARTGEWDWKGTPREGSFGLANAFLRAGVKHYVGTFWEIMDEPSSHFAHEFYERMCSGMSMGEAVKQARCNLIEKYGPDTCWASYILYGDPRVSYFSSDEQFEQTPASESAMIRSSPTRGTLFNYALNTTRLREMRNWLVAILVVIFLGIGIAGGNYVLKRLSANEQIRIQELLIEQAEKKQKRTEALFRELTEITGSGPQTQNAGGMRTLAMVFDSQISLSNQKTENLVAFAIQSELIEHSRFKILERKSFDAILQELIWEKPEQLSLLMPEVLLLLEVYDKDESPLVLMRLVDKKTGVVVANLFESLKKGLPVFEQKKQLSENLLKKLEDHYPLHGTILDIKGREATLNIGHDAGVRPGQRFRARNTDVILEVTVVNSDTCIASVEKEGMELKKGWQVEAIFSL